MYTHFDYQKVLAILKQHSKDVEIASKNYCMIGIETFEEVDSRCFNAMDNLCFKESFSIIESFCLINASFILEPMQPAEPLFAFEMGESKCRIVDYGTLPREDEKKFAKAAPFEEKEEEDWRNVLISFIDKVNYITKNQLMVTI